MGQRTAGYITVRAYGDGKCISNPGFGACGGHIEWPEGSPFGARSQEWAHIAPEVTNSYRMELQAILGALVLVRRAMASRNVAVKLFIYSDAQNVVQCAMGQLGVHTNRDLWQKFENEIACFPGEVMVQWIPREDNARADEIVARAMDATDNPALSGLVGNDAEEVLL